MLKLVHLRFFLLIIIYRLEEKQVFLLLQLPVSFSPFLNVQFERGMNMKYIFFCLQDASAVQRWLVPSADFASLLYSATPSLPPLQMKPLIQCMAYSHIYETWSPKQEVFSWFFSLYWNTCRGFLKVLLGVHRFQHFLICIFTRL